MNSKVRRFLEIRQALSRSANAKYAALARYASARDDRVRGTTVFHGASTGRNTGGGPQPLNMLRESHEDIDPLIQLIRAKDVKGIEVLYGSLANALAVATRQMIIAAPGRIFFCGDYEAIEGMGLAWEANETHILNNYRQGKDPYKVAAASILSIPYDQVTEGQRKYPGKIAELACGYQGSANAARQFDATGITNKTDWILAYLRAWGYDGMIAEYYPNMSKSDKKAIETEYSEQVQVTPKIEQIIQDQEIKDTIINPWRSNRPATVEFWKGTEEAAKKALSNPGSTIVYGRFKWGYGNNFLYCQLPSGRYLSYYKPEMQNRMQPWGKKAWVITYMGYKMVDGKPTQWCRVSTYGGKLVENVTQASMRDILREAKFAVAKAGYKIVLDVYDEILAEVSLSANRCLEEFLYIMTSINPSWAEGLPLAADGWQGPRYKKG